MPYKSAYITFIGKAGAGKDYILNKVIEYYPKIHKVVSATTRQPRENEKDGFDYFFLSEEEGNQWIADNAFIEYRFFRGWLYGTPIKELESGINAGIASLGGLLNMKKYLEDNGLTDEVKLIPVYITASDETRKARYQQRAKNQDNWERRYAADEEDFKDLYSTLAENFNIYFRINNDNNKPITSWFGIKWMGSIMRECQDIVIPKPEKSIYCMPKFLKYRKKGASNI